MFFLADTPQKVDKSIEQYVLRILAFLSFRFSQNILFLVLSNSSSDSHVNVVFFSSLVNKQLGRHARERG